MCIRDRDSIFGTFIHTNGTRWLVFAGPDPALRPALIFYAEPEPTAGEFFSAYFLRPLLYAAALAFLLAVLLAALVARSVVPVSYTHLDVYKRQEPNRAATTDPVVTTAAPCAAVGDLLAVSGEGFRPNVAGQVQWVDPLGSPRRAMLDGELVTFVADADGRFQACLLYTSRCV